jgi:hypothetical protein
MLIHTLVVHNSVLNYILYIHIMSPSRTYLQCVVGWPATRSVNVSAALHQELHNIKSIQDNERGWKPVDQLRSTCRDDSVGGGNCPCLRAVLEASVLGSISMH